MNLTELLTQVAPHIDEGPWSVRPRHEQAALLVAEDGREILVYYDSYGKRLEISGHYPEDETHRSFISSYENPPKITVSPTRDPRAIGRDISRRFLPEFNARWKEAVERERKHEAYLNTQRANAEHLAGAWSLSRIRPDFTGIKVGSLTQVGWYGHIQISDDTVSLELHNVPVEIAVQIAEALNGQEKPS
jgi:hypothetical protein